MYLSSKYLKLAGLLVLCAATSCGGSGSGVRSAAAPPPVEGSANGMPSFPAPAGLAPAPAPGPRAISYSEIDLSKAGWLYEHNMPNQRVADSAQPLAEYSPEFDSAAPQLAGLAYAIYKFDAEDYDRAAQLRLAWDNAPARENVWVALSDWQRDSWIWFKPDNNWRVNFSDTARFMKDGRLLLAALVVGGNEPASLQSLRLGPLAPVPTVTVSPQTGAPPLTVSFDASNSTAGEGSIAKYEWDFEGDGTYDLDSGTDATVDHEYTQGMYTARLRVTNTAGVSATVPSPPIKVESGWQHSFGRGSSDYAESLLLDSEGNIYFCGSSDDTGDEDNLSCLSLIKLNQQGELLWARGWRSSGHSYGLDLAEEADGGVVCAGSIQGNGEDARALVQHWSSSGELELSHEYSREAPVYVDNTLSLNGSVVITGLTTNNSFYDVYCMMLGADGAISWSRVEDIAGNDYSYCAELLSNSFSPPFGIALGGSGGLLPQMVVFDLLGQDASTRRLDLGLEDGEQAYMQGLIYYDDGFNQPLYYCAGSIMISLEERNSFVLKIGDSGSSLAAKRYIGPIQSFGFSNDGQGGLVVCGYDPGGTQRGWLGRFELPDLDLNYILSFAASNDVVLRDCSPVEDGLLLLGQAPNANVVRSASNIQTQFLSASWEDVESSGISNDFTMQQSSGTVFDLAPLLTIDSGGGHHDMYISLIQLPED